MTRIAVDAMGGDLGPAEIVAGALDARGDGLTPVLFAEPGTDLTSPSFGQITNTLNEGRTFQFQLRFRF